MPNLTFAEAMALDPGEVEFQLLGFVDWKRMVDYTGTGGLNLNAWRSAAFRRARPRRSRMQEMAEAKFLAGVAMVDALDCYLEAIRAVCEYLRSRTVPSDHIAAIEREFLEPR